jgi:hypothetical protein
MESLHTLLLGIDCSNLWSGHEKFGQQYAFFNLRLFLRIEHINIIKGSSKEVVLFLLVLYFCSKVYMSIYDFAKMNLPHNFTGRSKKTWLVTN